MQIRALVGGKVDQGSIRDTEVRCEILSLGKFFITILQKYCKQDLVLLLDLVVHMHLF